MATEAIILAAGRGNRLGVLTEDRPKCLLELAPGVTILGEQLRALSAGPIGRITVVVGYRGAQISAYVQEQFPDGRIDFVEAHEWQTKNNAASLRAGLDACSSGSAILQINSDVFADPSIIVDMANATNACPPEQALFAVKPAQCGEEEMKAVPGEAGGVSLLSKGADPRTALGEAFGINGFGSVFVARLRDVLMDIEEYEPNLYFEDGINRLLEEGMRAEAYMIGERSASEIDFSEDLERARKERSM